LTMETKDIQEKKLQKLYKQGRRPRGSGPEEEAE